MIYNFFFSLFYYAFYLFYHPYCGVLIFPEVTSFEKKQFMKTYIYLTILNNAYNKYRHFKEYYLLKIFCIQKITEGINFFDQLMLFTLLLKIDIDLKVLYLGG